MSKKNVFSLFRHHLHWAHFLHIKTAISKHSQQYNIRGFVELYPWYTNFACIFVMFYPFSCWYLCQPLHAPLREVVWLKVFISWRGQFASQPWCILRSIIQSGVQERCWSTPQAATSASEVDTAWHTCFTDLLQNQQMTGCQRERYSPMTGRLEASSTEVLIFQTNEVLRYS